MNKIDDILTRLQQAQQPTIDAPDELTERIMSSLPERGCLRPQHWRAKEIDSHIRELWVGLPALPKARCKWLYAVIGIAANVLLVMMLHFNNRNVETAEKPATAKNAQQQNAIATPAAVATESVAQQETTAIAQAIPDKRMRMARKKTKTEIPVPQKDLSELSETMPIDPSVQIEREFRAEAASIRQRGEQLMQHVAMLSEPQVTGIEYVEF